MTLQTTRLRVASKVDEVLIEDVLENEDVDEPSDPTVDKANHDTTWTMADLKWANIAWLSVFHVAALYAVWLYVTGSIRWQCAVYCYLLAGLSGLGVTAGAHRLWSHRAYKARWPLRLALALCHTMAAERDIYNWCRDHRVHHRYSETDADPHNSKRGFFFAHMGWLMLRKHPQVMAKGARLDMSDLMADPIVRWQRAHYRPLVVLCWAVVPTLLPYWAAGESLVNSFLLCVAFRYVYMLHVTWNVNSFAHMFGNQPYNRHIQPRENQAITYITYGEGYHNYHHTFPWDYSASEFGSTGNYNVTTAVIDLAAKVGLAYDLRKPTESSIVARMQKSGDHSVMVKDRSDRSVLWIGFDWFLGLFTSALFIWLMVAVRMVLVWVLKM